MKRKFKILNFIIVSSVIFLSCGKSKEPTPPPVTQEQHLRNNSWKLSAVETVPVIAGINPIDFLEDCYIDNIYSFEENNVLIVDEGPLKCNVDSDQRVFGKWEISEDQKQLSLEYGDIVQNFEILSVDEEEMKLQTTIVVQTFSFLANLTFVSVE